MKTAILWLLISWLPWTATAAGQSGGLDREVTWTSAGVRLAGSLRLPEGTGPFPAVVLISGTEPDTRDAPTHGLPLFRCLAEALARRGIASLRYDDRGTGASGGTGAWDYGLEVLTQDIRSALDLLQTRPGIDPARLGLVGHSLGAAIAAEVATRDRRVGFAALLAPYGMSGGELLLAYRRHACQRLEISALRCRTLLALDRRLISGEILHRRDYPRSPLADYDAFLLRFAHTALFKDFVREDPKAALEGLDRPLWIAWGADDRTAPPGSQLPLVVEALLRAGGRHADLEVRIFPGADHGFTLGRGGDQVCLAPGLAAGLADWAVRVTRRP